MDKSFSALAQGGKHKYHSNLLLYFNPGKSRVKIYYGNLLQYHFITLAPGSAHHLIFVVT
jgi:hypothetical protein